MRQTVAGPLEWREGDALIIMDRLYWPDGTAVTDASSGSYGTTSVAVRVYDLDGSDPATSIYSNSSIGTVFFATLQTDGRWTRDATGYNFRYTFSGTTFEAVGGHRYRFEFSPALHGSNLFSSQQTFVYEAVAQPAVTV